MTDQPAKFSASQIAHIEANDAAAAAAQAHEHEVAWTARRGSHVQCSGVGVCVEPDTTHCPLSRTYPL